MSGEISFTRLASNGIHSHCSLSRCCWGLRHVERGTRATGGAAAVAQPSRLLCAVGVVVGVGVAFSLRKTNSEGRGEKDSWPLERGSLTAYCMRVYVCVCV